MSASMCLPGKPRPLLCRWVRWEAEVGSLCVFGMVHLEDNRVSKCEKGGWGSPAVLWGFLSVQPLSGKPPVLLLSPWNEVMAEDHLQLLRLSIRPRLDPSLFSVPVTCDCPHPHGEKEENQRSCVNWDGSNMFEDVIVSIDCCWQV